MRTTFHIRGASSVNTSWNMNYLLTYFDPLNKAEEFRVLVKMWFQRLVAILQMRAAFWPDKPRQAKTSPGHRDQAHSLQFAIKCTRCTDKHSYISQIWYILIWFRSLVNTIINLVTNFARRPLCLSACLWVVCTYCRWQFCNWFAHKIDG